MMMVFQASPQLKVLGFYMSCFPRSSQEVISGLVGSVSAPLLF